MTKVSFPPCHPPEFSVGTHVLIATYDRPCPTGVFVPLLAQGVIRTVDSKGERWRYGVQVYACWRGTVDHNVDHGMTWSTYVWEENVFRLSDGNAANVRALILAGEQNTKHNVYEKGEQHE